MIFHWRVLFSRTAHAPRKTIALQNQVQERIKIGDSKFADSLELMIFLANLVGSEHIERFIPVASAENERSLARDTATAAAAAATAAAPTSTAATTITAAASAASSSSATATREMPQFVATKRTPPPSGTAQVARTERKTAPPPKPAARPAAKQPLKPAAPARGPALKRGTAADRANAETTAEEQVIADAVRLVQWGRKWYELPELIARMADRPPLPEVRRILKENKLVIDQKAGSV